MRRFITPIRLAIFAFSIGAGLTAVHALAAPLVLESGTVNMFRDTRGANNVGVFAGDLIQYGGNIVGGSAGASVGATAATGFVDPQEVCAPLAVNANFCANGTLFSAARTAPWTLNFARSGATPVMVAGPSLVGAEVAVPFPVNVTISGSGLTPTISWTVPGGFAADAVRINIFDRNKILANGSADVIHTMPVASSNGSYTIPSTLNSGQQLNFGGDYVFNIQLIDTRGSGAIFVANGNNAEILRRSSSFFNFTPLPGGGPPNVALPTVVNGVYNFSITNVGPNSVTFIDPFVAVGYDYAIGAGDPNFASVLLPTGIGDNLFDLFLWDGSQFVDTGNDLQGGSQFFFGSGGVGRFSIRGIETSAGLDPSNVTAFVTGLTFTAAGSFTGSMTPIIVQVANAVPEPGSVPLVLMALVVLAGLRRKSLSVAL